MRVSVKGGVWKNTEDEILKAAVMKYGKNQWARISSLLTRKSPKQCKARWFEWLDPSIKKTEWSREEDEKLIYLAKLMPTQWRTISPIVGRTPAQCLERYQRLLEDADEGDSGDPRISSEDVRRLRPGEIDPEPETRPARPDPVDMDEDEKEMLSEARARLANTQGKKAKRKAREKQLEEARRLSYLQKRRELKAAGLDIKEWKAKRRIDYNLDIPFQRKPPTGFWDISAEDELEKRTKPDMTNILLSKLEGKRRAEAEENSRKKDTKRIKTKMESGGYIPKSATKILQELEFTKRGKLELPPSQISMNELDTLVKIGRSGSAANELIDSSENAPTNILLSDYKVLLSTQDGTSRTPITQETDIRTQVKNVKAITNSQTPLLGDNVDIEGKMNFQLPPPKSAITPTINPLASNFTPDMFTERGFSINASVRATPIRDKMRINQEKAFDCASSEKSFSTSSRYSLAPSSKHIREIFSKLQPSKNDFEIIIPEKYAAKSGYRKDEIEMDKAQVLRMEEKRKEEEARINFQLSTKAVQRNLPRPVQINPDDILMDPQIELETQSKKKGPKKSKRKSKQDPNNLATSLIRDKMLDLLKVDAFNNPTKGQKQIVSYESSEKFTIEELNKAEQLIKNELPNVKNVWESLSDMRSNLRSSYIEKTPNTGVMVRVKDLNEGERIQIYREFILYYRKIAKEKAISAKKMESKLLVLLSGFQMRSKNIWKEIEELLEKKLELQRTYNSFLYLQILESENFKYRIKREAANRKKFHEYNRTE